MAVSAFPSSAASSEGCASDQGLAVSLTCSTASSEAFASVCGLAVLDPHAVIESSAANVAATQLGLNAKLLICPSCRQNTPSGKANSTIARRACNRDHSANCSDNCVSVERFAVQLQARRRVGPSILHRCPSGGIVSCNGFMPASSHGP